MSNKKLQLELLNNTIKQARNSKLYKFKLSKCPNKLKDLSELQNFPLTTKKELRDCFPFGSLAVPIEKIVEVHTSSGTTGQASLSYYTKEDLKEGSKAVSKAWQCFGINEKSRVQFMMSYGLFSGASLNTYAIQELGGLVIPSGIQSAEKQIQMLIDFKIDTIVATPGYYFYLFDYLSDKKIRPEKLFLKRGIAAGEIYSDNVREEIERKFKIRIFDHYGLCEVYTGIAYECEFKKGLHILDDYVIAEIIDPKNGQVLPPGSEGELVLTSLRKEASPVIRYRTGDITSLKTDKCPCGRGSVRIDRIKRRADDLFFVKGIKIDPHELQDLMLETAKGSIYRDIQIKVDNKFQNLRPEILVSLKDPTNTELLDLIQKSLKNKTLLTFDVKHVEKDFFQRSHSNKIKLVEYVDKK